MRLCIRTTLLRLPHMHRILIVIWLGLERMVGGVVVPAAVVGGLLCTIRGTFLAGIHVGGSLTGSLLLVIFAVL